MIFTQQRLLGLLLEPESGVSLAGQLAEIAVSLDKTAVESHTTIEGREVRDVIRKPYKIPNKKGNYPKSRPRNYL